MNKLKFLFMFCLFASAPEETVKSFTGNPDFVCPKLSFAEERNALDGLLEGLQPDQAIQVYFYNSGGFCFERGGLRSTKPYQFGRDSWRLVVFGLGSVHELKTIIQEKARFPGGNACFITHWEKEKLSFQFYQWIPRANEIPDLVETNLDLRNVCYNDTKCEMLLISAHTFFRLAYDRKIKNLLLRRSDNSYTLQKGKKSEYIPTMHASTDIIWVDSSICGSEDLYDLSTIIFYHVRSNIFPNLSLSHLLSGIKDIADNFELNCDWFDVTDPSKGLYLEPTGKVSATNKKIQKAQIVSIDQIRSYLVGKDFQGAQISEAKKGEIEIAIKAIEIKKEPEAPEPKPEEELVPEPESTSPGTGSSTDVPKTTPVVIAAPEPEPKIAIPQKAFESELQFRTTIALSPTPKKPLKNDKMLFNREKFCEYKRTDNTEGYEFTEVILRIIEGEEFSYNMKGKMRVSDLLRFIKTFNENCDKLNISPIEPHPEMVGNARVIFAQYEGNLCFGIGKTAADIGNDGHVLKGGQKKSLSPTA